MEEHRFDDVARRLSGGTTRRGVFRLLAAGAAGSLGTLTGAGAKAAPGGDKGKPTKPPCCPTGYDALCTIGDRPTCVDTRTDAANCGACGVTCPSGICTNGACTTVCTPGSTGASCTAGIGACERTGVLVCNPDGSGYACDAVTGTPQTETCNGIDDDCDGVIDNGFDFATDVNNCGACNQVCQLSNATSACVNSTCQVASCDAGYADCDGIASNGCETNTTNDVTSCGGCGNICTAPPTNGTVACVNSACVVSCGLGYHVAGTSTDPQCVADPTGVFSVWVFPNPLPVGTVGTGTVTLATAAVTDTSVSLSSSDPVGLPVPASVVVPAGQTSATFSVQWQAGGVSIATITATLGSQTVTTEVALAP